MDQRHVCPIVQSQIRALEFALNSILIERGRAMVHVIEYFAKSLKVSQGYLKYTVEQGLEPATTRSQVRRSITKPPRHPYLSPYQCSIETMSVSRTVSERFSLKECRDLETGGRGRSRSLKMAPYDRSYTTFYWSAIVSIALSCCTSFELFHNK